jgi:hypothetical protein
MGEPMIESPLKEGQEKPVKMDMVDDFMSMKEPSSDEQPSPIRGINKFMSE